MRVKVTWTRLALLAVGGAAAALFVAWSGLISISASSGHFAATRWFLGFAMENAVEKQSIPVTKPEEFDLQDPALVRRSAGHYATGCAPCHGAPGVPQSPVVGAMTPAPPRLEDKVSEWSDEELFWIVKHGIKYSGMPAWPTQDRDDEVWAQVAFLRALPGMTREEYADLALGGGQSGDPLEAGGEALAALDGIVGEALTDCARCHGRDGLPPEDGPAADAIPAIAGQPEPYLAATLHAFSTGARDSGFMQPAAHRYSSEVLDELARHFAEQPPPAALSAEVAADSDPSPDPASTQDEAGVLEAREGEPISMTSGGVTGRENLLDLGRRIALRGDPDSKIPACESCHGRAGMRRNPYYPYLAGQPEWYLSTQLKLWQEETRGGTRYAHVMAEIAHNMTEAQIEATSAWYAELSKTAER